VGRQKGPSGVKGTAIPLIARISYMTAFLEIFHQMKGRDAAIELAKDRRGKAFDPSAVDAFLAIAEKAEFWEVLESNLVWDSLLEMEPDSQYRFTSLEKLPEVALSFADFADMKSKFARGQSRRVAETSVAIARKMGLPDEEISTIHLAALMHNLGVVTIPSLLLEKAPEELTNSELEQVRLHPYHGQRILASVPELEAVAELVGAHHERMDGKGYHRSLRGSQIPMGARIIAVADRYDELCHEMPGHPAMESTEALDLMAQEVDAALSPDAFDGLVHALEGDDHPQRHRTSRRQWPVGLTDREVDVLRLIAKGMNRAQVADALTVSESTVPSHLEHIYSKAGINSRAAATMFAMEHALV
jgi:HD-GYP domain-containing protein (c-di-GMP phosphodiesterase class II)